MTIDEASQWVLTVSEAMNKAFKRTVFDEYAIVATLKGKACLVWYWGPRKDSFLSRFREDTAALKAASRARLFAEYGVGDFEFTFQGEGEKSEAFVVVGEGLYLFCNNTTQSMNEISRDPRWLSAQQHFAELSDRFRFDALVLDATLEGPELGRW
ncbi:MAG TPA: hypothetical protein P5186_10140 [Candidatus Paceibacterota bacterium]|nr:hypothetical protein [Candidatus Paceibacterota bacterium]